MIETYLFFNGDLSFFRGDMSFFNGDLSFFHSDMLFFRGDLSFFHGDMSFFDGNLSFFHGDMSFFDGNLSFFHGDMSFFDGNLSFFHGDLSFFRGDMSFFDGNLSFFRGNLSFFHGDMSFFNGVYLELFTKGFVCRAIENGEIKINRPVAQKEIHFSNSMIEAVNKRMKYDFLFRARLPDLEHTCRFLETAVEQYNNRSHSALFGFTPQEVFYGAIPDKLFFKPQIEQAKALRKAESQALSYHHCALAETKEQ